MALTPNKGLNVVIVTKKIIPMGAKVIVDERFPAKVLAYFPNEDMYEIEFEDKELIPPIMTFPSRLIRSVKNLDICPVCKNPWMITKSPVTGEVWEDCKKCKKKKEDILA